MRAISARQIAICQTARRSLGLAEEDYRAILHRRGRVESTRDLTQSGLTLVLAEFERLGFHNTSTKRPFSAETRPGFASERQIALLRRLWGEFVGDLGSSDAALGRWLDRRGYASALRFLSADDAPLAITGLKAMARRRLAERTDAPDAPCGARSGG